MNKYLVTNKKDSEKYLIKAKNFQETNTWIVNHLDLSKEWSVTDYLSRGWFWDKEK